MSIKIALISPGKSSRFAVQEPLNLGYIASYLIKYGYEPIIIDELAGDDVKAKLAEFKPDIAGITATTPVVYHAYRIADECRKNGILTVIGGVHATFFPEEAKEHADIVVKREGELAMLDIAAGRIKSGIIDGKFLEDIDLVPPPARRLMRMDKYLYCKKNVPYIYHLPYAAAGMRIIHILTSRGCPHAKCIFCHNSLKNIPYRMNCPEFVIEEIKQLKRDYDVQALYFVEDNFFANNERAVKISELMIKEGLDKIIWGASSRVESVNPEVLNAAKRAGCKMVTIGYESGSQRILDLLKKEYTVEASRKSVEIIRQAGLIPHGNFIIGNPTETMEDVELTKKFIIETGIVLPEIYIFTPYPGSVSWNIFKEQGLIPDKIDWQKFTQERVVGNVSKIPSEKIEALRARMLLSSYLRQKKYAFRLIIDTIRYQPAAVFEKAFVTFVPVILRPLGGILSRLMLKDKNGKK